MSAASASTSDLLAMAAARLDRVGVIKVARGDVAALCIDVPTDRWVLFPVAEVADGMVVSVVDGDGVAVDWAHVAVSGEVFAMPRAWFREAGLRALIWREKFVGLAVLRAAMSALLLERRH